MLEREFQTVNSTSQERTMKIIVSVLVLFTVQGKIHGIFVCFSSIRSEEYSLAQYDDVPVTENDRTVFTNDGGKFSTAIPDLISSDGSYTRQPWSFLSTNDFDMTTFLDETKVTLEEQWFNVNQSQRRDSLRSFLFWKRQGRWIVIC